MYDLQLSNQQTLNGPRSADAYGGLDPDARTYLRAATSLFNHACALGRLRMLWALLTRRPARLLDLAHEAPAGVVSGGHYAGMQTVAIADIRGSEGRSGDFDLAFNPRHERLRERWLGIAMARCAGAALPAVKLIRLNGIYFVRDGHHRISVARALGEAFIEAEVTVWSAPGNTPTADAQPMPVVGQMSAAACGAEL